MANSSISVKLEIADNQKTEGVNLKRDGAWFSSGGGWLRVQSGKWLQDPGNSGVILKDDFNGRLGTLLALTFSSATTGSTGRFHYEAGGDGKSWTVVANAP
jgi:hypothetical protein